MTSLPIIQQQPTSNYNNSDQWNSFLKKLRTKSDLPVNAFIRISFTDPDNHRCEIYSNSDLKQIAKEYGTSVNEKITININIEVLGLNFTKYEERYNKEIKLYVKEKIAIRQKQIEVIRKQLGLDVRSLNIPLYTKDLKSKFIIEPIDIINDVSVVVELDESNNNRKTMVNNAVDNVLSMKEQSFITFFYKAAKNADKYYQTFVDNEFNDLDILMDFQSTDVELLMDECHMNRIHARNLLKNIKVLKENNQYFQQWLMNIGMKRKYYKQMINAGIATLSMLEQRFVCVTDFAVFLGAEDDEEREMDGIFIWENMPKNLKKSKNKNNNQKSVTYGNIVNAGEGKEGVEGTT